ncbi:hypothetical protein RFI_31473 [Reticulomyxa filosa]|uniref:Rho-GAP domain-containing protein n=1 Tax=Reticulomyxa filosa TaxID=46433 RepID=X6LYY5_RETFI|nr:hypothetical protein RFI_31473 [Reticulomyxa filosa]|eukprot:ETO05925.1 hypothetical protein RFI_31473 [Reticulomyxa filosa]
MPWIESLSLLTNLEFIDISGNKIGLWNNGVLCNSWLENIRKNTHLRVVKFFGNQLSAEQMHHMLQMLATHPSIFEKIPKQEINKLIKKNKKFADPIQQALENVRKQFRNNRLKFEMDQDSVLKQICLTKKKKKKKNKQKTKKRRRILLLICISQQIFFACLFKSKWEGCKVRMEKELRRSVGCQFGVPIERLRGSVQYPDYESRIPQILVRLREHLKEKEGLKREGVFRLQPDGKQFPIVKQMLDSNVPTLDMDHDCTANAIKVWFRDLPVKVLNPMPLDKIEKPSKLEDMAQTIREFLPEPYRSVFEWLLDVAVEVCEFKELNRMDARNIAVVLCPNLYDTSHMASPQALAFSQSLLKFMELAVKWRIEYRKTHPFRPADDLPLSKPEPLSPVQDIHQLEAVIVEEDEEDEEDDEEQAYQDDDEEKAKEKDKEKEQQSHANANVHVNIDNSNSNNNAIEEKEPPVTIIIASSNNKPSQKFVPSKQDDDDHVDEEKQSFSLEKEHDFFFVLFLCVHMYGNAKKKKKKKKTKQNKK